LLPLLLLNGGQNRGVVPNPYAAAFARLELTRLFDRFPDLAIQPSEFGSVRISGSVDFQVEDAELGHLIDTYSVEIVVPQSFPIGLPTVREVGGRIPKTFHKLNDGSLCLGSPLRLRAILATNPSLLAFTEKGILPYLAGFSIFQRSGRMPFDELAHGSPGLYDDYRSLLGVTSDNACFEFLRCLSVRRRVANKRPCFCASGLQLGRCHNRKVNKMRSIATRGQFRGTVAGLRRTGRPAIDTQK
jgi:hypothetical protein